MRKKRGFTLVELLVVISIIAMLLSILIPSLSRARESARSVVCGSNLRQFGLVFGMYAQNNNDKFMPYRWYADPSQDTFDYFWMKTLRSYYGKVDDIRFCPTANKKTDMLYGSAKTAWEFKFRGVNGIKINDYGSYGINCWVQNSGSPASILPPWAPYNDKSLFWNSPNVSGSSNVPLLLDSGWVDGWTLDTDMAPPDGSGSQMRAGVMTRWCFDRHKMYINGVFLDMSVRKTHVTELWNLKWHRKFQTKSKMPISWPR